MVSVAFFDHYPFEMFRARSAGGNVARILPKGIMIGNRRGGPYCELFIYMRELNAGTQSLGLSPRLESFAAGAKEFFYAATLR